MEGAEGVEGHKVVVVVVVVAAGRGSQSWAPSARNNKQAFSYSNKYQASGEQGGVADKEEAGERGRLEDGSSATLRPI